MPWESRIESEPLRRAVIAAVMLVLLAGSTALALWMTHARRPHVDVADSTEDLGPFRLSVPRDWIRLDIADQNIPGLLAAYQSPEADRQLLQIFSLDYDTPRPPAHSLSAVAESFFPRGYTRHAQTLGQDGTVWAYAVQQSEEVSRLGRQRRKHFLATVTLDGRRHAAFYMTGLGNPTRRDLGALLTVAESTADTRYRRVGTSAIEFDAMRLEVPDDLFAFHRTDVPEAVDFVPAAEGRLASGRLVHLRLRVVPFGTDAPAPPPDEPQTHDAASADTVNRMLLTWLANVYHQRYGSAPPDGALETGEIGGRVVHAVLLPATAGSPVHRMLFASSTDGRTVAVVDVVAEPPAMRPAEAAAKMVMAGLEPAEPPNRPAVTKDQDQAG